MHPLELAKKYDKIAHWWNDKHQSSNYGVEQFNKALEFCTNHKNALDIGCGAGGRFINILENKSFSITGLDVSKEMISLAKKNHNNQQFINEDICTWQSDEKFDFIVAWDSIFHLPLNEQKNVIEKMANLLNDKGVVLYTFGDECGEHEDSWLDDTFYYSSIGINENINTLINSGLSVLHVELDQYPQKHVYIIATKK